MAEKKEQPVATFDVIRSPSFRVVHSNGVWGGITPHNELSVTFFSEKFALPSRMKHPINADTTIGEPILEEGEILYQREAEFEILINKKQAVLLYEWLGNHISEWNDAS